MKGVFGYLNRISYMIPGFSRQFGGLIDIKKEEPREELVKGIGSNPTSTKSRKCVPAMMVVEPGQTRRDIDELEHP